VVRAVDHDIATGVCPDMRRTETSQRAAWDAGFRFDFENPEYR
jgi:hypothetical protein